MTEVLAEKKYLWIVIIIVICLVGLSASIYFVSNSTMPDLNSEVKVINVDYLNVWNGTDRVLLRSGVTNSTSDNNEYIFFWVNASQFTNLQFVRFFYYNGTNGEYYNSSKPIDNHNSWNFEQWWTDYSFYYSSEFNTTDSTYTRQYTIPKQKGNTEVTFQLSLALWNGTGFEFQEYNSTYTVSYAEYEVWFEKEYCWEARFNRGFPERIVTCAARNYRQHTFGSGSCQRNSGLRRSRPVCTQWPGAAAS